MVLIDPLLRYGSKEWCHMASDLQDQAAAAEELHAVAQRIGMRRAWYQARQGLPHYDLQPIMRRRAIRAGAREVTSSELVRRCSTNPQLRRNPNDKPEETDHA